MNFGILFQFSFSINSHCAAGAPRHLGLRAMGPLSPALRRT